MVEITIDGIASNRVVTELKNSFPGGIKNVSGIVLFCQFSAYDIKLGKMFTRLTVEGEVKYSGAVTLVKITQQFDRLFEEIPKGWRTVCEFRFDNLTSDKLKEWLPVIDSWSQGTTKRVVLVQ
ncbi:MAG: hypothetical protein QM781_13180 [Chitinophagaceae bacterium]